MKFETWVELGAQPGVDGVEVGAVVYFDYQPFEGATLTYPGAPEGVYLGSVMADGDEVRDQLDANTFDRLEREALDYARDRAMSPKQFKQSYFY